MKSPKFEQRFPRLIGWMSLPPEELLWTPEQKMIYGMSRAAMKAVLATAAAGAYFHAWRDSAYRQFDAMDVPLNASDNQLFGTPVSENIYNWKGLVPHRSTNERTAAAISSRLLAGMYVYNETVLPVYRDLAAASDSRPVPASAVHIYTAWLSPTPEQPDFIPVDRRNS